MALPAVLPKLVLVHILVAIGALCKGNPLEFGRFLAVNLTDLVALGTLNGAMTAGKREFRLRVVETGNGFKCVGIVAKQAIARQCLLMEIRMAIEAGRPQPQVAAGGFARFLYLDIFALVAGGAADPAMFSLKFIARFAVIKLGRIEPDDLEISAMMLIMTGIALLAGYICRRVVSSFQIDKFPDLGMTFQTLYRNHLLANLVAFATV